MDDEREREKEGGGRKKERTKIERRWTEHE
jgi:hypothetical protein